MDIWSTYRKLLPLTDPWPLPHAALPQLQIPSATHVHNAYKTINELFHSRRVQRDRTELSLRCSSVQSVAVYKPLDVH